MCVFIIIVLWLLAGILSHVKFHQMAEDEGDLEAVDAFGIFVVYLLSPWFVLNAFIKYVIIERWS
jgi:hypothetical protein